jgi:hypothetical protein
MALAAALAALLALASVLSAGERARAGAPRPSAGLPPPATVTITVGSGVPGARVFLDDAEIGPAGVGLAVPAGRAVDVSVRAPGFVPFDLQIAPTADERIEAVLVPTLPSPSPSPEA